MEDWSPPKFKCAECESVIWSRWPGQYIQCECGAIAVDQTRYYSRYLGEPENFIEFKEKSSGR